MCVLDWCPDSGRNSQLPYYRRKEGRVSVGEDNFWCLTNVVLVFGCSFFSSCIMEYVLGLCPDNGCNSGQRLQQHAALQCKPTKKNAVRTSLKLSFSATLKNLA